MSQPCYTPQGAHCVFSFSAKQRQWPCPSLYQRRSGGQKETEALHRNRQRGHPSSQTCENCNFILRMLHNSALFYFLQNHHKKNFLFIHPLCTSVFHFGFPRPRCERLRTCHLTPVKCQADPSRSGDNVKRGNQLKRIGSPLQDGYK